MKIKAIIIVFFAFTACNNEREKKNLSVQGVFVTTYESEYSKAIDTIEITPLNPGAGTFNYVRRTTYRRLSNGVPGPLEHKAENSICVFNENTAQLNEQRHGRIYSLSSDGNQLHSVNSVYNRIQ